VEKRRGAGAADDAVAAGHIKAPMPGKILKVLVKEGDTVAAESTLVVMEAMKMEYSLAAPVASRVKAIKCKEGQQVALSHVLVELEPAT
jgi:3-methylcrotonyl-CoA carboxylase alpha subunit